MSYYKFSATRMNSTTPHTNDRTRKRQKTAPTNTDPDHQHPQQDRNRKDATTPTTTTTNPEPPQDPDDTDPLPPDYYYPRTIVTWNCNGTGRVLALLLFLSFSSPTLPLISTSRSLPRSSFLHWISSNAIQSNQIKSNRIKIEFNAYNGIEIGIYNIHPQD